MIFLSSKLLVVGDSYCMNYIKMRNTVHIENKEPYILWDPHRKITREFDWYYMKEFDIWPDIVANYYEMDLINLSESGAGNYSIYSTALDAIVSNKIDKAIIVWSGFNRWEFEAEYLNLSRRVYKNGELITSGDKIYPKGQARSTWMRYHNNEYWGVEQNVKYRTNVLDDLSKNGAFGLKASVNTFLRLTYSMQQVCKSLNIELKMFQSVRPLKTTTLNKEAAKIMLKDPYLDKIDNESFKGFPTIDYIGGECFSDVIYTDDAKYKISKYDGHPNEEGQKKIASYVVS